MEDRPRLRDLARVAGVSPFHLQREFKSAVGVSPREYAQARRSELLKQRLKSGASVTEALYDAGYSSSSRLYERADKELGMTPGTYRQGGKGERISYTIAVSPLGEMLVAMTELGICFIAFSDSETVLDDLLRKEFPRAELQRAPKQMELIVGSLVSHLRGERPELDFPLDIRATVFQRLVWERLRQIPAGETWSYEKLAQSIGKPKASRAVANACARNPVAIAVPCHRVIHKDGSLSGYRWGAERKEQLLAQERKSYDEKNR